MPGFFRVLRAADPANRPPPAHRIERALAAAMDVALAAGLFGAFYYFWGEHPDDRHWNVNGCPGCLLILLLPLLWLIPESLSGASFGKLLMGLRLYSLDRRDLSTGRLFRRDCVKFIDLCVSLHIVGLFIALSNPLRQSLADLSAETMVVDKAELQKWRAAQWGRVVGEPAPQTDNTTP